MLKLSNGGHALTAKVYDKAGNVGEGTVVIYIQN